MTEPIDFSRYRIAKAITDRFAAGESLDDIGADYFDAEGFTYKPSWIVELIVAAHDREGKYEASILGEPPEGYDATREDV